MKPVTVAVTVPNPRDDVFGFLDVIANHEPFTNHMMVDWSHSGPPSGVGARARMRVKKSRLAAPITRSIVRRGNQRALERLAQQLGPTADA